MAADPNQAFVRVYDELRGIAQQRLAGLPVGQTLQATALVHEAWLRLLGRGARPDSDADLADRDPDPGPAADRVSQHLEVRDEEHFRALAAQAMRWILVDHARRRGAVKRDAGGRSDVDVHELGGGDKAGMPVDDPGAMLRLDRALTALDQQDTRRAQVVQLRFFGGMSVAQTAKALDVSVATVKRDWGFARAWLLRAMDRDGDGDGDGDGDATEDRSPETRSPENREKA
ncbi:MAG: ECF-type sigma factor [Planctomycetota bacterium]